MARFFIDRPIFAWVLAIIVMLVGTLSIFKLPISQYPAIAPPAVTIQTSYPGASAQTVQDTVTQVIEQRMKGIDGLRDIKSVSDSTGAVEITLTFEPGTNPDTAQVQTQNKLALATPMLPQEVQRQGVQVNKSSSTFLLIYGFLSADGSMTDTDLSDYLVTHVQDPISRVPGVGEVQMFGGAYAMRIWLDPSKLNNYRLDPADVRAALTAQNAQISAGELGGAPFAAHQRAEAELDVELLGAHLAEVVGAADAHRAQLQRRRRQQPRIQLAGHAHRRADDPARLGLELRAELVPVDEIRPDERRHQRDDEGDRQSEQGRLHGVSSRVPPGAAATLEEPAPGHRGI